MNCYLQGGSTMLWEGPRHDSDWSLDTAIARNDRRQLARNADATTGDDNADAMTRDDNATTVQTKCRKTSIATT
eukprot:scaffold128810_cov39-Prasinocladus_malaysianus.AAC.1